MREMTPFERRLAEECAARHRIPKSTVAHPTGVIVQGDDFMTEKLQDPDYVPYCGPCDPMQRIRRTSFGFECPRCHRKSNYDLTPYDGNMNVQYKGQHPVLTKDQWNEQVDARKAAKSAKKGGMT